jgi:hypothetical protein
MRIPAAATLLIVLAAAPQSPKPARDQLGDLQAKAVAATKAGDQQTRIAADLELLRLLNDAPSVHQALARAYAAAGDTQKALAALNHFADLGQADDNLLNGTDQRLSALASLPEYKQILDRFRQNEAPVSLGVTALTISDPGLLTEDIDFDPTTRTFLITSVLEHKIVRAPLNSPPGTAGAVTDFASSPDSWPVLAIKVDAARHRVWATEVALDGFTTAPKDAWGRSAVLCYDLTTGKLLRRIEGPPRSALGDMVLTSDGDPIVSDGEGGGLYRLSGDSLTPINTADFISPQTPVMMPGGDRVLVPDYVRGLAIVNLQTRQVSWLNSDGPAKVALSGVDGVYLHNQQLILTQNGTSPERVVLVNLDPSLTRIMSTKVIEQTAPGLGDPTHGVVVGDDFYYIANSGWNQLGDHGDPKPGSHPTPAHIQRYSLR